MRLSEVNAIAKREARSHGKDATYQLLGWAYMRPNVFVITIRIRHPFKDINRLHIRVEDRIMYGWKEDGKAHVRGSFIIQGRSHRAA